jgi:hypothetical protein
LYFCSPLTSLSFSPLSWLLAPSLASLYVFFLCAFNSLFQQVLSPKKKTHQIQSLRNRQDPLAQTLKKKTQIITHTWIRKKKD